jgi:hypothetical protein
VPSGREGETMQRIQSLLRFGAIVIAGASLACKKTPPPPTVATILVDFPGTTATNPALLLYSGKAGPDCRVFEPNVGAPTVTLPSVSWDPSCAVEIDAFAPGLGAFANSIDPAAPGSEAWLIAAIETGTLSVPLGVATPVPLQIWLVADTPGDILVAETMRDRLLDKAYPVFATLGTGLTLDTASATLAASAVPVHCNSAGAMSTNSAIYDASRINVYFIRDYAGLTNLKPAENCWLKGHPEIVFISWANTRVYDPTLAHELGHALGLVHPNPLGGHTYLQPGFDAYNFMASNTDVTNASIGQIYSLNFSNVSWLNRTGSAFLRPVVRNCQDTWGTGACPALTLFEAGWPP